MGIRVRWVELFLLWILYKLFYSLDIGVLKVFWDVSFMDMKKFYVKNVIYVETEKLIGNSVKCELKLE